MQRNIKYINVKSVSNCIPINCEIIIGYRQQFKVLTLRICRLQRVI